MAERQGFCSSCGYPINFRSVPVVRVGTSGNRLLYHSICWVMRWAPSAQSPAMVN